jgi:Tol biopolymer transport system component
MVLNLQTGDARQVVGGVGFDPAFSPDGHSLAFRRPAGIWIEGLDGSGLHQLTNEHPNRPLAFSDFGPAFSPDGKRLVFERSRSEDDHTAVFVQSLDSSGSPEDARRITPWNMNCGDGPEFSPKGDWVLFSCTPEGGASNLFGGACFVEEQDLQWLVLRLSASDPPYPTGEVFLKASWSWGYSFSWRGLPVLSFTLRRLRSWPTPSG